MKLVDIAPGSSIWAAAEAMVAMAKQHNEMVCAVFNGTEIVATPTTDPKYIMSRYTEDHEELRLLKQEGRKVNLVKKRRTKEWLTTNLKNNEFRRLFKQELLVEQFIVQIEEAMTAAGVTKTELAKRMQCSVSKASRALQSPANMTLATMVDIAFSLNLQIEVVLHETSRHNECLDCGVRVSARRRAGATSTA